MRKFRIVILSLLTSVIALNALAYDAVGHRIIAKVAYDHLTTKARKQCDKVLGKNGLIYASTWADEIRSDKNFNYSYQWHFQNLKDSMTVSDLEKLWKNPLSEGEHLFFAIQKMKERILANKNDAEALKFMIHFMADLHQPMHLGRAEDLGANKISVQWFGRQTNLHSVWDGQITESKKMSATEYSLYLEDVFQNSKKQKLNESLLQSVYNVYKLRTEIYANGFDDKGNYAYLYKFSNRNEEMMYSAGIQLAKMINELY